MISIRRIGLISAFAAACTPSAQASALSSINAWAAGVTQHLGTVYDQGGTELLAPGYTWHDPGTYTEAKRATLNSHAWGIGFSRNLEDAGGNQELLYAMVFSDSHYNAEPIAGYAKQWNWHPFGGEFRIGGGYTVAVTSRADIMRNVPFPIALPVASVGYGKLTLYGTMLPRFNGSPNNGNVAFFFAGYKF